jgi:hypothetical protein
MKNKNCIYYCLYGNDKKYYNLLILSLMSLSQVFDKNNIIVFSENVSEEIEQYAKVIKITFPNGYAIPMAYRLILGETLIEEYQYDNILHIDVDTIIIENIDNIFDCFENGEISFATEVPKNPSRIVDDYWAGPLLNSDELIKYKDISSICCGVFGFNKTVCGELKNIYNNVIEKEKNGVELICRDQHAFVEYVLKNNLYNYNLQNYVDHQPMNKLNSIDISDQIFKKINHFAGGVTSNDKYERMEKLYKLIKTK